MRCTANTPVETRIEHMLTEARVLLPGAQAMLGFQLAVLLTESFTQLPESAMLCMPLRCCFLTATACLTSTAPAAFHRITFQGESTEAFHALGSGLVLAGLWLVAPLVLRGCQGAVP